MANGKNASRFHRTAHCLARFSGRAGLQPPGAHEAHAHSFSTDVRRARARSFGSPAHNAARALLLSRLRRKKGSAAAAVPVRRSAHGALCDWQRRAQGRVRLLLPRTPAHAQPDKQQTPHPTPPADRPAWPKDRRCLRGFCGQWKWAQAPRLAPRGRGGTPLLGAGTGHGWNSPPRTGHCRERGADRGCAPGRASPQSAPSRPVAPWSIRSRLRTALEGPTSWAALCPLRFVPLPAGSKEGAQRETERLPTPACSSRLADGSKGRQRHLVGGT